MKAWRLLPGNNGTTTPTDVASMKALNAGIISELGLDVQHGALCVTHGFHGLHFVLVPQVCSCVEGLDLSTQSHQVGMRIDLGAGFSAGFNFAEAAPFLPPVVCTWLM